MVLESPSSNQERQAQVRVHYKSWSYRTTSIKPVYEIAVIKIFDPFGKFLALKNMSRVVLRLNEIRISSLVKYRVFFTMVFFSLWAEIPILALIWKVIDLHLHRVLACHDRTSSESLTAPVKIRHKCGTRCMVVNSSPQKPTHKHQHPSRLVPIQWPHFVSCPPLP